MKAYLVALVLFLALGSRAEAQEPPVATPPTFGFSLPSVEGTLTYGLSASESFVTGYGNGADYSTAFSGSLGYLSSSPDKPFSLVYSGGYLYSSVSSYPTSSTFQNLAASQVITTKNWNFVIDDAVSYLPESPTTGLSGIPGVGDIGVDPVQIGDQPPQTILTNYATRVGNGLNGGVTRNFGKSLSINGSASWQILHFTNNEGIDSSTVNASVGPTYHIDARSSVSANAVYSYTKDTYADLTYPFETEGVNVQYQRQLTRFFSMSVSAGPQRTFGTGAAATLIPSEITPVASATLTYARRTTSASVSFSRATNAGSGVLYGALTNNIGATVRQQFSRDWQGALTVSYSQSTSLAKIPGAGESYDATYGGGQISRRLGRSFSAYFSYTAVHQNQTNVVIVQPVFSGLSQTFSVGITYSPGPHHLGHY